jgi:hypothetical protein
VCLSDGFSAAGVVSLSNADIGGRLVCRGARLAASDERGFALAADRMRVSGDVLLSDGFSTAGAVSLSNADIGGRLVCRGAQLAASDERGIALAADKTTIGGDVYLDEGFITGGAISLASAHIGDSVYLAPARLATTGVALDAAKARIGGVLKWAPCEQVRGQVNLEGAEVGELEDDWSTDRANGYWPTGGVLLLNGFIYGRFTGRSQATVRQRLEWIRSQYRRSSTGWLGFATQPYDCLVAAYRQAGQEFQARQAAIAKRVDLRKYGNLNAYRRFGNWLLDKTIKYGYQNWRAGVAMVYVYLVVVALSILAQQHHLMVPVNDLVVGVHPVPVATRCTPSYPCFYPVGYAIDVVFPLVSVHQADFWGIDGSTPWGWVFTASTWIATVLGWTGATFLVAGLTSLVRRQ